MVVTANDGFDDSIGHFIAHHDCQSCTNHRQVSIASSDSFYNDSTLTCTATADDLDANDGLIRCLMLTLVNLDSGATLDLANRDAWNGGYLLCYRNGWSRFLVDGMETIANRLPTIDAISLPQDATAETTSLFCDATTSDLDGETPTVSYLGCGW